jgi:hypothetical protein
MMRRRSIGIALLALSHLAFANVSSALAQAGSIGGTIGNQDKTIPGGGDADGPRPVEKPKPDRIPAPKSQTDAKMKRGGGPKTFDRPTINCIRVDYCSAWLYVKCGEPAATMWCQSAGLTRATS